MLRNVKSDSTEDRDHVLNWMEYNRFYSYIAPLEVQDAPDIADALGEHLMMWVAPKGDALLAQWQKEHPTTL